MTQVYFHCCNPKGVMLDRCGAAVGDLADVRDEAERLMRSLIMSEIPEDWRGWVLHVSDDLGEEIFVMPFASVIGKLH